MDSNLLLIAKYLQQLHPSGAYATGKRGRGYPTFNEQGKKIGTHHNFFRNVTWEEEPKSDKLHFIGQARHILSIIQEKKNA
jgi:hypothetical protein